LHVFVRPLPRERGRRLTGVFLGCVAAMFALLIVLCTVTDIDRKLSARFYRADVPQEWFLKELPPWRWLYQYGEYPALLMALAAFSVLCSSVWRRAWANYRRPCLVVILSVALGPGVLVNGLLKPYWGRPRPRHIVQFGGTQEFRPWWRPSGPESGKSFPSGHAAMGYVLISGATLVTCRRFWLRRWAVASALAYGTLMGLTRIVQGGHFLSDVACSGLLVTLLVIVLRRTLIRRDDFRVGARCVER
jgi:lipid A 4'-phosphatase